uniref:Xylulose kinase-1 n=1 Tax=Tanacetum cinerariifolium TaxID=118510 RepID=A0A6L2JX62_TANCI|nr:hypothetical protein [Tanacetum cinerariifolium]
MALTFADTHNMIAHLTKSDASEGFKQILNFLNASVINYALTVNPTIYVSCIKQFWSSVSIKKVNDFVHQALDLDDAECIDCLPNEEIFVKLARMSLVRNVDSSSKFYMYPRFLQLMTAAQVGDLTSHTTKYTSPALTHKVFANIRRVGKGFSRVNTPLFEGMLVQQQAADDVVADNVPANDVDDVVANDIIADDVTDEDAFKQEGIIAKIDADKDVTLEEVAAKVDTTKDAKVEKNANDDKPEPDELKEVIEVVTTTKLMTEVVTAATTITAATITAAPSAARKRKGVVIRDPEETATPSTIVSWRKVKNSWKKRKAEHLRGKLRVLSNDVYTKATPLALKVPVVDYQIHTSNNKPYYKVIRADGTHQLFLSFLSLLRNFDREDLEVLWQIVQEIFASSKPNNFSNDFLLATLKAMFEKPDVEAQVWKNPRGIHDDLASREKISLDKAHSRSNGQQCKTGSQRRE